MINQFIPKLNLEGIEKRYNNLQEKLINSLEKGITIEEYRMTKEFEKNSKKSKKTVYQLLSVKGEHINHGTEHLINSFRNYIDDDSWKDCYIFNTNDMEIVEKELEEMYVEINGSTWSSSYDCTGMAFYRGCNFYKSENRIYVIQSGGLDV